MVWGIFSWHTLGRLVPTLGVDRLSAWPIIGADIKHFFFLCKQTYYLQVTLFIGE